MKTDLKLKCLKKTNAQALAAANKQSRMTRARQLLKKYPATMVNFMFSLMKKSSSLLPLTIRRTTVFTSVQAPERRTSTKTDCFAQERTIASQSWCQSAYRSLAALLSIFFEPGVQVNGECYRNNLIGQKLLPDMRRLSQDEFFLCFNRMAPPAHRARDTITYLQQQTPDFIPPTLWPPNSPDLKPVDYSIWSVLQEKVYCSKITDVDELKTRLMDQWAQFDQSIVDAASSQWRRRLSAKCPCTRGTLRT